MKKLILLQKQMILTSKRSAEHPFAGGNTQHIGCELRLCSTFMFINDPSLKTVAIRLFEQTFCSWRQLSFEICRNNEHRIGMNTAANKFYHINKLIGLNKLNLSFVHYKKFMKYQFLKYGNTWSEYRALLNGKFLFFAITINI